MQKDFHYYATYCAAYIAGFSHDECMQICGSDQLCDLCTRTYLSKVKAPLSAATTQLQLEMMDADTDIRGLQDITRIWASFHFLPRDLYAEPGKGGKRYKNKYRLICGPNGDLVVDTVKLAKRSSLQAAGIAMHVLADTWAHMYFAGTPSLVINNTDHWFYELIPGENGFTEKQVVFSHNPMSPDDPETGKYVNTIFQPGENTIMNLGHGRAGHLPDYGFMRYKYLPAWNDYKAVTKDNPSDYMHAFCQMIYALKYYLGKTEDFEKDRYDFEAAAPWKDEIEEILLKRKTDTCEEWKALAVKLSGREIEDFDESSYQTEYVNAPEDQKDDTFLGKFIIAALKHKSMITNKIFRSGNMLAGVSVEYAEKGFKGIRDFKKLLQQNGEGPQDE